MKRAKSRCKLVREKGEGLRAKGNLIKWKLSIHLRKDKKKKMGDSERMSNRLGGRERVDN